MTEPSHNETGMYDLKSVKLPYLTGLPLRLFVALLESPLRGLLVPSLLKNAGLTWLRKQSFDEPPTLFPLAFRGVLASESSSMDLSDLPAPPAEPGPGFRFTTAHDFAQAYRKGRADPVQVAQKILETMADSDAREPPLRAMMAVDRDDLLRQAEQSRRRLEAGKPVSILEGVPVAIKDEFDMVPYATWVGTAFMGGPPVAEDATVVARLRAAGALLIGKANLTEIGIGVTGLNPHHGTPRNPYDPAHYTGGSSSGPASAIAAGLCPIAIGADGGGSLRTPAAFCGLLALKATFGRVSEHGAAPTNWSVAHIGPLAATATDLALAYAVIAGPDTRDPRSLHQPPPTLSGWDDLDLSDLTLGVYWPWFRHATTEVVTACEGMLDAFVSGGASIREVVIPDLEAARAAHLIAIGTEMAQALDRYLGQRHKWGLDVRLNMALLRELTARDRILAERVRTRLMANLNQALADVDAIVTPTTGLTAPRILEAALAGGESDLTTLTEIMRFVTPPNVTGHPAISFPAGYSAAGLPIGMQAIGRAWQEPTLLRLALAAEQAVERLHPQIHYRVLEA